MKALVYTSGEWVKGTMLSETDGADVFALIRLESGRDLFVPKDDVILLDQDYTDWFGVASFLAGILGEALGVDGLNVYRKAQSLATRILAKRGVTITPFHSTA